MSECNHDCGSCSANCESRTTDKTSFLEALAPESKVKKVIGIVSGKGGVGKSLVTSMLAVSMNRKGHHTAILDADITGPSIPMAFGVADERPAVTPDGRLMIPAKSLEGVEIMSANLLLENATDPVIWRGPVIAGAVKAVLDGNPVAGRGLYVCGYASGNRRRASDGFPVSSGRRNYHRYLSSGTGRHDRGKGC